MAITVECPGCGKMYRVPDDKAGKRFGCKQCQTAVSIPAGDDDYDVGGYDDFGDDYGDDDHGDDYGDPKPRRRSAAQGGSRPRKKQRRSKKSSANPGVIIGGVVGGLVLIGVVVGGIMLIGNPFSAYGKHKRLADEAIDIMEEVVSAMESITDQPSAAAAAERIDRATDRLESLAERAEKLPKISKADDKRLREEMDEKMDGLKGRMTAASMQAARFARSEPKLLAALTRMRNVGMKMQKSGGRF